MLVLITTCRRPRGTDYLNPLLRQVLQETRAVMVVSDGPLEVELANRVRVPLIKASPEPRGQKFAYWSALRLGSSWGDDDDGEDRRVTILEDDVVLCRNALAYMERVQLPENLDLVSWYDGHAVERISLPGRPAGGHIVAVQAERFACLQAVTYPQRTIRRLLEAPAAARWREPHGGDNLIAEVLRGRHYGVHLPNLVDHVGADSIVSPGQSLEGMRRARNFPGADFDALQLLR